MHVARELAQRLRCELFNGYGLTESCAMATALDGQAHREAIATGDEQRLSSVGRAVPGMEVSIVGDDHRELAPGEVGQIALRGLKVSSGYLDRPDATAERFLPDGWMLTGDQGHLSAARRPDPGRAHRRDDHLRRHQRAARRGRGRGARPRWRGVLRGVRRAERALGPGGPARGRRRRRGEASAPRSCGRSWPGGWTATRCPRWCTSWRSCPTPRSESFSARRSRRASPVAHPETDARPTSGVPEP